jgi:hypothetical protein
VGVPPVCAASTRLELAERLTNHGRSITPSLPGKSGRFLDMSCVTFASGAVCASCCTCAAWAPDISQTMRTLPNNTNASGTLSFMDLTHQPFV